MSVARYDEKPFPYQIEAYHELAGGQWVEVRENDVKLPIGAMGVVLKQIAETGNYQVAVQLEGEPRKRVIALCPDQVRPVDPPLPDELPKAAAPEPERKDRLSPEGRERQRQATKDYWAKKKAARAMDIDAKLTEVSQKLEERAVEIVGAPRRKLTERPAPEILDVPDPAEEPEPETELVEAIRHLQGYRDQSRFVVTAPAPPPPRLVEVTWTQRAADAIRPVLAEAAAAGGEVTQLALLVETISYLEDGGRP